MHPSRTGEGHEGVLLYLSCAICPSAPLALLAHDHDPLGCHLLVAHTEHEDHPLRVDCVPAPDCCTPWHTNRPNPPSR